MKILLVLIISVFLINCNPPNKKNNSFSFVFFGDTRDATGDNIDHFRGACEAISTLDSIEFVVSAW